MKNPFIESPVDAAPLAKVIAKAPMRPQAGGAAACPSGILQTAFGFMASKVLFSAIELGIFTLLSSSPMDGDMLAKRAGLHPRAARDFLDALVALKFLDRVGGSYANTPAAAEFLDRNKPCYIGGLLEMADARLYGFWHQLSTALRTGEPQNECTKGESSFDALYSDSERLECFLKAMTGISLAPARSIAEAFDWSKYKTVLDVGCAEGALLTQLALGHEHLRGYGYDLPVVQPIFQRYTHSHRVADRVHFRPGNFFEDPTLPHADVIVMGHILHDWSLAEKRTLLAKAFAALPSGGAVIVYESMIDNDRRENVAGLLMSLNMLIETPGGFDFTAADCSQWMQEAGFTRPVTQSLAGGKTMVVASKA